jgi:hypothetical protein
MDEYIKKHSCDSVAVIFKLSVSYQSVVPVRLVVSSDAIVLNLEILSRAQSEPCHVLSKALLD